MEEILINENDVINALKWVEEQKADTKILETLKNLCERNISSNMVLYTEDNGIDVMGNIHFRSENDCPRCGHQIKYWRPYCEKCGQRHNVKKEGF